jgi:hypothetical protein
MVAWFLLIGAGLGAAHGATKIYIGPDNGTWHTPGNWTGGVPQDGDDLIFPVGVAPRSINDLGGLSLRSMRFEGTHDVDGNTIALSDGVVALANVQIDAPVTLIGDQEWTTTSPMVIDQLATGGHTLTLAGGVSSTFRFLALSGGGAIVKNNAGSLQPMSAAAFTGSFTANAGTLTIQSADGLGTSDGTAATATVINDGATLLVLFVPAVGEAITLNGNGVGGVYGALHIENLGTTTFTGAITLAGPAAVWENTSGSPLINFAGPIGGPAICSSRTPRGSISRRRRTRSPAACSSPAARTAP